jgi:hypothetical protein
MYRHLAEVTVEWSARAPELEGRLLPPLRFAVADHGEHLLGAGEPTARLRCDAFTLARVLMGRRSRRQVAGAVDASSGDIF